MDDREIWEGLRDNAERRLLELQEQLADAHCRKREAQRVMTDIQRQLAELEQESI
ncbi:hypothetical protein [Agromyces sp. CCNWLW203]|uniref:hypothetical protein n=1 Tax=Agromyces sp. CCNWLW203 TaxID=3112842 RepID=UPI002F96D012